MITVGENSVREVSGQERISGFPKLAIDELLFIRKIYLSDMPIYSAEESPNDFDKNHKFKVDAHLVM
ncbi:hypothetical protein [Vibrio scophthalmi]|uniref:hypothetical protein n=1 Tax=Vibrio scophthalmi TaxID=45658 RepID=UPI00080BFBD7|nr:hypothetical protein [Vibrio scophthalmi]